MGGDDNALTVSTLQICSSQQQQHQQENVDIKLNKKLQFKFTDTKNRSDAHVSSITGNYFLVVRYLLYITFYI